MKVANRIEIKRRLLDLGFENLKEYCEKKGLDYQAVRNILSGIYNGSRSRKTKKIKNQLLKDFGKEILKEV